MAKQILTILILLASLHAFASRDTTTPRHFVAAQFGGQTFFSVHYEYSIVVKKHFVLNTNFGLGINENADDPFDTSKLVGFKIMI
ncbi:MAG: hypothetical protein ACI9NN_000484 [Bacteroidia bacterium]|jgi:hypothetical protein